MTTTRTLSEEFLTMTTKDDSGFAKELSLVAMTAPTIPSAAATAATAAAAATASSPSPTAVAPSRGKLFDMLKLAIATGVGLVFGAGVMYVYLRSFSNVGKEIHLVAQSVNNLKGKATTLLANHARVFTSSNV